MSDWVSVAQTRHFDEAYEYLESVGVPKDVFVYQEDKDAITYLSKDGHYRVRAYVDERGRSTRAVEMNFGPIFREKVEEIMSILAWAQETFSAEDYAKFLEMFARLVKEDV